MVFSLAARVVQFCMRVGVEGGNVTCRVCVGRKETSVLGVAEWGKRAGCNMMSRQL